MSQTDIRDALRRIVLEMLGVPLKSVRIEVDQSRIVVEFETVSEPLWPAPPCTPGED